MGLPVSPAAIDTDASQTAPSHGVVDDASQQCRASAHAQRFAFAEQSSAQLQTPSENPGQWTLLAPATATRVTTATRTIALKRSKDLRPGATSGEGPAGRGAPSTVADAFGDGPLVHGGLSGGFMTLERHRIPCPDL